MANRKFFAGILAMALVFGMALVGCSDDDGDTWSNVTSLSQVDGTWKGSYTVTTTEEGLTYKAVMGITSTINASARTQTSVINTTVTVSGKDINTYWPTIKEVFKGPGVTFNDSNHSFSWTENSSGSISLSDFSDTQINQKGNKLKERDEDGEEFILTKQ